MRKIQFRKFLLFVFLLFPFFVFAHCPLCTIGTGILAVIAKEFGVKTQVVGIFLGAFAVALGFWISKLIKKRFPFKVGILVVLSFLSTIFPLKFLLKDIGYVSLFNFTFFYDKFIFGSIIGGFLMIVSPTLSKKYRYLEEEKFFHFKH